MASPLEVADVILFLIAMAWFIGANNIKDKLNITVFRFFGWLHLAGIICLHIVDYLK